MVGSIDPRCETARGTHWPKKVAWLFGARVAETILASGPKSPHQQAGHMDASDPIKPSKKLLWHGGRPHMELASRKPSWPAVQSHRINRPDIWTQAIRSNRRKNSCGTGAVHIWVPVFTATKESPFSWSCVSA